MTFVCVLYNLYYRLLHVGKLTYSGENGASEDQNDGL